MDYKKSFSDMIDQFLLLTDQNKMTWSITTYEKKMDAIFVGENDVSYIISYEWEFSPSGWKIDTPSLRIKCPGIKDLYLSTYAFENLKSLSKMIYDRFGNNFKPNVSEINDAVLSITTKFSIKERRENIIDSIIKSDSVN